MLNFESGNLLHDRLVNTISTSYQNHDSATFEYATSLFEELRIKYAAKLAQQALAEARRLELEAEICEAELMSADIEKITKTTLKEVDLTRFEDYPSQRVSLHAIDKNGHQIFMNRSIAKKLYRCLECRGDIGIGSEHVIIGIVHGSNNNHHHLHSSCLHDRYLPRLKNIRIIKPKNATATKINAKNRRFRYQHNR